MAVNGADLDESRLSKASPIRVGSADEGMWVMAVVGTLGIQLSGRRSRSWNDHGRFLKGAIAVGAAMAFEG